MSFRIRPFDHSQRDYTCCVELENLVWPDYPTSVAEQRHNDATRNPGVFFQRYVLELDGTAVGTGVIGAANWVEHPHKYYAALSVHPAFRKRGIGGRFYEFARSQLRGRQATLLQTSTREDQKGTLSFLAKRGFQAVMRYPVFHLELAKFEPANFASFLDGVQAQGIHILSAAQWRGQDPNWEYQLWELGELQIMQDIPTMDPYAPKSFQSFKASFLESPNFSAEATFIAFDGRLPVGLSTLWVPVMRKDRVYTGLTGVIRSHRRLGIGMALNIRALMVAKQYGAQVVETDVEDNSISHINEQLGFTAQPAWLDLEKNL